MRLHREVKQKKISLGNRHEIKEEEAHLGKVTGFLYWNVGK